MGAEQPAKYYDGVMNENYNPNIPEIYDRIIEIFKQRKFQSPHILEIGCGVGILAKQLFENGYNNYLGLDFSKVAIETAKKYNKEQSHKFEIHDIYDPGIYRFPWDVIIGTEVLEHVNDIKVVENIKEGTLCIFSVPIAPDIAHIRTYSNPKFIQDRFSAHFTIESIEEFDTEKGRIRTKYLFVAHKRPKGR